LCLVQCSLLLGIVQWGADLAGPSLPMFALIWLTSIVGVAIGLCVSAAARTSEVAIALLPLILLPMVILAGVLQPLHKMNLVTEGLASIMPSRWAFEGLLVLEAGHRPTWTPPATIVPAAVEPERASGDRAEQQDMAEPFFPLETRFGQVSSFVVLCVMLALLVGAVHGILRARDVH
jgi:hypothetical protein